MGALLVRQKLTPEAVMHIKGHKYVAGKYTIMDNFLNPFWTTCCNLMPRWLAPNTITLIGLLTVLSTVVMAGAWLTGQPPGKFHGTLPWWMHLIIAAVELFYQTMDAIDGKQARRTNCSSPLGQLFDHGCDAIATSVLIFHLCSAMGLGYSPYAATLLVLGLFVFYLAQWEETVTGVLRTNVGQLGVTEAQFVAMAIHLFVGLVDVGNLLCADVSWGTLHIGGFRWQAFSKVNEAIALAIILVAAGAGCQLLFEAIRTAKQKGRRRAALAPLCASIVLAASTLASFAFANSGRLTVAAELPGYLLFLFTVSQVHLSTKTIVFGMGKQHFSRFQMQGLTVPLLLLLDLLDHGVAQAATPIVCALSFAAYLSLVTSFIWQISGAMGIKVFKITPPPPEAVPAGAMEAASRAPIPGAFMTGPEPPGGGPAEEVLAGGRKAASARKRGKQDGAGLRIPSGLARADES